MSLALMVKEKIMRKPACLRHLHNVLKVGANGSNLLTVAMGASNYFRKLQKDHDDTFEEIRCRSPKHSATGNSCHRSRSAHTGTLARRATRGRLPPIQFTTSRSPSFFSCTPHGQLRSPPDENVLRVLVSWGFK
ncbi:jg10009 [Pararge aegeria aegeria]|uniref:Jg10009 protein n=1 Tax=Pararge aegeria aegeria TaxID=348720 RepID=A0A8S4SAD5_9NEOP|nr:jg10009 [Pararge aegeria aegeria]